MLDADPPPEETLRHLLTERFAADGATLYGSGTQALTAALRIALATTGPDRPVALPAFSCYDTATAAVGAGARILLYDLDPATLAPDWSSVERALALGAGVVVLAPLYGFPFDWAPAEELSARFDAALVEDAAQAADGEWNSQPIGTFGTLTVLSFGRGKGWTGGSGGALLWRGTTADVEGAPINPPRRREIRTAAAVLAQWLLARPGIYGLPHAIPWLHLGETHYRSPEPETAISRFSAALLLATDEAARAEVEGRRKLGRAFAHGLAASRRVICVSWSDSAAPGFLRFPCRFPDRAQAREAARALGHLGVENSYPTTLLELPAVRERLATPTPPVIPGAKILARELVTLPTHSRGTPREREQLANRLRGSPLSQSSPTAPVH